jgi:CHAD domain-containing protein
MADEPTPLPVAFARDADRSFRLHRHEPLPDGMRRIARGRLDEAAGKLAAATGETLAEAVHSTRKQLKRVRASVRLSRDAIGERTYEHEQLVLRSAGRRLAAGRDAQVLLDTLDDLRARHPDELPEHLLAPLRRRLDDERREAERALGGERAREVLAALDKARERTAQWAFERDGFDALSPGLRRIYRRGRRAMRVAREDPSPDNLHAWRKRVKDLWHATQIVADAYPKRLDRFARRAHRLADVLGDGHDLHVLRAYVEAHPLALAHEPTRRALLSIIERRADSLRDKALKRGAKLYERKPAKFVSKIERGWTARTA